MGFCFKRKESVQKAINRLGRERMAHALKALKDCRQAEAIHRVRKDIKKARALLVMVRSDIEGKMFRRQIKALREAAGLLSDLRDAFVVTSALKTLSSHFTHQLAGHAIDQLRGPLTQNLHDEMRLFSQGRTDLKVARALRSAIKGFDRLTLCSKGWAALGPGLKSTYSRARQA